MVEQSVAGRVIRVAERDIPIGGPSPPIREGEKLLRRTLSLCPECYRLLPAVVFERDGKVFIRRVCPEHGEVEELYWGDAGFYERALGFEAPPMRIEPIVPMTAPCPFSCGLCPAHGDMTALANIVLTNRCNLDCWYCFFYAERAGFVYEPSLEQIRRMIRVLRSERPVPGLAVQLTGGEPTLRDDLVDIIKMIKEEGVRHIQLNTHGITFLKRPELMRQVREAGVNTMYLSFDGVTPRTNVKNHWEMPYILDIARKSGMTSIVLVPTVINGFNTQELGDIIRFAALNIDVIRGVNFQPISLTGRVPRSERERLRITIPDVIRLIEEQTDGQIPMDSWYPIPFVTFLSDLVEALTGKPQFRMTNHPACGAATYAFPEYERVDGERRVKRFVPITDFIDVEGFREYVLEKVEELRSGANRWVTLLKIAANLSRFIDRERQPEGINVLSLMRQVLMRRNYDALAEFHYKSLFLGMMHFMDLYNYDVQRVMRCNIHYLSPDGRVIPFCTFNVLPDLYRDYVQRQYGVPLEEYAKAHGTGAIGPESKYRRDVKRLESGEPYKRTYAPFMHLWRES